MSETTYYQRNREVILTEKKIIMKITKNYQERESKR